MNTTRRPGQRRRCNILAITKRDSVMSLKMDSHSHRHLCGRQRIANRQLQTVTRKMTEMLQTRKSPMKVTRQKIVETTQEVSEQNRRKKQENILTLPTDRLLKRVLDCRTSGATPDIDLIPCRVKSDNDKQSAALIALKNIFMMLKTRAHERYS